MAESLIHAYGLFWNESDVYWGKGSQRGQLLGVPTTGRSQEPVDFRGQAGIQAKRWENTVGRPEVQKFAGALQGHRAKKGVMITTAGVSREASEYVATTDCRIVLIVGPEGLGRLGCPTSVR